MFLAFKKWVEKISTAGYNGAHMVVLYPLHGNLIANITKIYIIIRNAHVSGTFICITNVIIGLFTQVISDVRTHILSCYQFSEPTIRIYSIEQTFTIQIKVFLKKLAIYFCGFGLVYFWLEQFYFTVHCRCLQDTTGSLQGFPVVGKPCNIYRLLGNPIIIMVFPRNL